MSHADPTPLRRAAYLLLLVSTARWGWAASRMPRSDASAGVEPAHLAAATERVERRERADRPLEPAERIDPNTADVIALDRLPGIGPATAEAIVASREEGPPFTRPEELARVRGIGPATVERLRPWLTFGPAARSAGPRAGLARARDAGVARVDINRATADALERLPGVGPAIAARIVEERSERPFSSVDDLVRVQGVGRVTVDRLRPLVRVDGRR